MCGQHHELATSAAAEAPGTSGALLPPLSIPSGLVQPHLPVFSTLASGSPTSPSALKPLVIISPKMKAQALGCSWL